MNRLVVFAFAAILSTTACSRDKASDEEGGFGTRGGGDVCERDYRARLTTALVWLRSEAVMSESEKNTVLTVTEATLDAVAIVCSTVRLSIDGVRKTAITTVNGLSVSTQVDSNMWLAASPDERDGIAAHEILLMLGIEKTADYHISQAYAPEYTFRLIQSITCTKGISNNRAFAFQLEAMPSLDGSEPLYRAQMGMDPAGQPIQLSSNLRCTFSDFGQVLFNCYEPTGTGIRNDPTGVELVNTDKGTELRVYWGNLQAPSLTIDRAFQVIKYFVPFYKEAPKDGIFAFVLQSPGLDLPLDAAEASRCTVLERP